jgi:hypothetical protein
MPGAFSKEPNSILALAMCGKRQDAAEVKVLILDVFHLTEFRNL